MVGLIVDRVDDVTTIEDENIAAVPENSLGCENKYIEGIGKTSHDVVLILNAKRLLKHDEREMLEQMGHE